MHEICGRLGDRDFVVNGRSVKGPNKKNCPSRGECQALGVVHSSFQWTGVQVTVVELHHWHHSPPNVGQLRSAGCGCHLWNKCHAHLSTPAGREQSNRIWAPFCGWIALCKLVEWANEMKKHISSADALFDLPTLYDLGQLQKRPGIQAIQGHAGIIASYYLHMWRV
ncbi:hypothetical protein T07_11330 [Trichinella nelsoni]|uniref:Uncharacterized protein n=1 Tax=Trichinella nelsoni TaxID=6336 RepID=A0A0V0RX92_9BILA|nr:hypothetical protein T07_11330 [Trichinella nelsoni]